MLHEQKIMQYSLRLYLVFHSGLTAASLMRNRKSSSWGADVVKRFETTVNGFSLARSVTFSSNSIRQLTVEQTVSHPLQLARPTDSHHGAAHR